MNPMNLINATHLHLITDIDTGICYANCPRWHGCDCPTYFSR